MSEIEVKIDYFSVTFPLELNDNDSVLFKVYDVVKEIALFLNVKPFEILKAKYAQNNYNYQFNLGEFIILRLDGPMNENYQKTCHLEMKGEACRDYERRNKDKSWLDLILYVAELNAKFKRIDIAIDDFKGEDINLGWLQEKFMKKHYTSIFKLPPEPHGTLATGLTIQFGTTKSPTQLIIYDKFEERKKHKIIPKHNYWVRYEMRFRNDTADRIIFHLCKDYDKNGKLDLQGFAFSQLYRIMDIKTENNYDEKSQHKVLTDMHWQKFLGNIKKGNLPKIEDVIIKTMSDYLEAAIPYITTWLLATFLIVDKNPHLFEIEIYKLMLNNLTLSKKRFQRLNMLLNEMNLKTINDEELASLKADFERIIEDKELPF